MAFQLLAQLAEHLRPLLELLPHLLPDAVRCGHGSGGYRHPFAQPLPYPFLHLFRHRQVERTPRQQTAHILNLSAKPDHRCQRRRQEQADRKGLPPPLPPEGKERSGGKGAGIDAASAPGQIQSQAKASARPWPVGGHSGQKAEAGQHDPR